MTLATSFRLKIQQIDHVCLFELSWGQGQQLTATLKYPLTLTTSYQDWRQSYLGFYGTIRGRSLQEISAPKNINWQFKLVAAEAKLLNEFHHWLRSAELYEIRKTIAQVSRHLVSQNAGEQQSIDVFLTCTPIDLARFPWEAWEIGTDLAATGVIRIVRSPANIRVEPARKRRQKARILAILGDETGLDFQTDRAAVASLSRIAEVKFVGWQPGRDVNAVKDQIREAIVEDEGWDILFFAGHSNETAITGGELSIAPNTSIQMSEIASQLTIAQQRGLQFAIFNSCSGLRIAESLIDLGFSQVAVMREPVQNRVAQEFLVQFIRSLAEFKDVHESLLAACQFLRLEKNLTYPSAYLVPILFCHPSATLYRIEPFGWKQRLRKLAPMRLEAVALGLFLAIGFIPQVEGVLLDRRLWAEALYRNFTNQVPAQTTPPVTLVQIDNTSVIHDPRIVDDPAPISRKYLAELIDRLTAQKAKVIGIDYLLDRPVSNTATLRQSIQDSVALHQTQFVFGATYKQELANTFVTEQSKTADQTWSMQAYVNYWLTFYPSYVAPLYAGKDCRQSCPFGYLLSLLHLANQELGERLPQPQLGSTQGLRKSVLDAIDAQVTKGTALDQLNHLRLNPLSAWVGNHWRLVWWQPLIDYSIPPDRIYSRIAAWRVIEDSTLKLDLSQQVVIIGAGDYDDPKGRVQGDLDVYPTPAAVEYWRENLPLDNPASTFPSGAYKNDPRYISVLTGAEAHAYMVHHFLTQHQVVAIPYFWMVGLVGLLGRGVVVLMKYRQQQFRWTYRQQKQSVGVLIAATVLNGLISLQLYVGVGLLVPWLLPSALFWIYLLPTLRKKPHG